VDDCEEANSPDAGRGETPNFGALGSYAEANSPDAGG
jgi:hypothetical protein